MSERASLQRPPPGRAGGRAGEGLRRPGVPFKRAALRRCARLGEAARRPSWRGRRARAGSRVERRHAALAGRGRARALTRNGGGLCPGGARAPGAPRGSPGQRCASGLGTRRGRTSAEWGPRGGGFGGRGSRLALAPAPPTFLPGLSHAWGGGLCRTALLRSPRGCGRARFCAARRGAGWRLPGLSRFRLRGAMRLRRHPKRAYSEVSSPAAPPPPPQKACMTGSVVHVASSVRVDLILHSPHPSEAWGTLLQPSPCAFTLEYHRRSLTPE